MNAFASKDGVPAFVVDRCNLNLGGVIATYCSVCVPDFVAQAVRVMVGDNHT
jgi:hypothetical protein